MKGCVNSNECIEVHCDRVEIDVDNYHYFNAFSFIQPSMLQNYYYIHHGLQEKKEVLDVYYVSPRLSEIFKNGNPTLFRDVPEGRYICAKPGLEYVKYCTLLISRFELLCVSDHDGEAVAFADVDGTRITPGVYCGQNCMGSMYKACISCCVGTTDLRVDQLFSHVAIVYC